MCTRLLKVSTCRSEVGGRESPESKGQNTLLRHAGADVSRQTKPPVMRAVFSLAGALSRTWVAHFVSAFQQSHDVILSSTLNIMYSNLCSFTETNAGTFRRCHSDLCSTSTQCVSHQRMHNLWHHLHKSFKCAFRVRDFDRMLLIHCQDFFLGGGSYFAFHAPKENVSHITGCFEILKGGRSCLKVQRSNKLCLINVQFALNCYFAKDKKKKKTKRVRHKQPTESQCSHKQHNTEFNHGINHWSINTVIPTFHEFVFDSVAAITLV